NRVRHQSNAHANSTADGKKSSDGCFRLLPRRIEPVHWIIPSVEIEVYLLPSPPNRILRRPPTHHRVVIPRTKPHEPCPGIKQPSRKPERHRLHVPLQHRHLTERRVLRPEEHVRDVVRVHHEPHAADLVAHDAVHHAAPQSGTCPRDPYTNCATRSPAPSSSATGFSWS